MPGIALPRVLGGIMIVEFVTHASVIYRRGPVQLICDPWLTGTAFDDGWALLSPPVFKPEDFAGITHIWFSHEHPDHFSPRSLSSIPEALRRNITVMYHSSDDGKIREFCTGLGFRDFLELSGDRTFVLDQGFEIVCDRWRGSDDSWLLVRTPEGSLLNLNDCQINLQHDAEGLRARLGPVDVLLTQFSISAWDGNVEDLARRQVGSQIMLDRIVMQSRAFGARYVIPFASFVWCCHEENSYMNEEMVGVRSAAQRVEREVGVQAVVLYPGDTWEICTPHDSGSALIRYEHDTQSLATRLPYRSPAVDLAELEVIARRFQKRLNEGISPLRRRLRAVKLNVLHQLRVRRPWPVGVGIAALQILLMRTRPARIWLTDHRVVVQFDLIGGLRGSTLGREACDIEISSAALAYALRFLWGGESLQVNGRFREVYPEGRIALFDYLWIASAMNHARGAQARPL